MKTLKKTIASILFICFALATQPTLAAPLDRIVATVNQNIITQSDLDRNTKQIKQELKLSHKKIPNASALKKIALDQLISQSLQESILKLSSIHITDAQVKAAISHVATQNHLSLSALYQKLTDHGIKKKTYQTNIKKQLAMIQLQSQAVAGDIHISTKEINSFIKKHKTNNTTLYEVGDILFALNPNTNETIKSTAKKRALATMKKITAGHSFSEMAILESSDPNVKESMGSLGLRPLKDYPTIFSQKIATLKVGSLIGPIEAPNGWHVLKLIKKQKQAPTMSKNQIRNILFQQKMLPAVKKWLASLRKQASIHIFTDNK